MSSQTLEFKTEVKQLLDLVIHSLYSHKEIFLRELVSNASDAIDKVRYLSLTQNNILEGDSDYTIRVKIDKDGKSLTISDNGIGMNEDEIVRALGTIAHSGTKEFLEKMSQPDARSNPELIGQFGVGFYSAFMVADRVVVISRKAGEERGKAVRWESRADGTFSVESFEKSSRGTDIILYLKDDASDYLESWQLRTILKKYSDYIEHPIFIVGGADAKDEDQSVNSRKALWLKDKAEISAEEYSEFYKHVSHDFSDPSKVIHFKAEGTAEFASLLFLPAKAPFDLFHKEYKFGPTLYVRRVQIMDHCEELLPVYLRFVKGVVESSDLPLNVSREILQNNKQIEIIRKNIIKKVLDTLTEWKQADRDAYTGFYREFRKTLKEGIYSDPQRRQTIQDLLMFESTRTAPGTFTTLQAYVDAMKPDQEFVYYMAGASREEIERSPYLEAFRDQEMEVLFFTDEIDDFISADMEVAGKKFKSATKGDIAVSKEAEKEKKEAQKTYGKLVDRIKSTLKDDVKDVRFSSRLKDSLCCLVAEEGDMDSNMERILKALGQSPTATKRVLELNPQHGLFRRMQTLFEKNEQAEVLSDYSRLLLDQALILEGNKPKDPVLFAKRIAQLMTESDRLT